MKKVLVTLCLLAISTGIANAYLISYNQRDYKYSPINQVEIQRKLNEQTFNDNARNKRFNHYINNPNGENYIKLDKSIYSKNNRNHKIK